VIEQLHPNQRKKLDLKDDIPLYISMQFSRAKQAANFLEAKKYNLCAPCE
jgi:hypothetical protein